jgi:hypothetical protein
MFRETKNAVFSGEGVKTGEDIESITGDVKLQ